MRGRSRNRLRACAKIATAKDVENTRIRDIGGSSDEDRWFGASFLMERERRCFNEC